MLNVFLGAILIYSLFSALPWQGTWKGLIGQMKIDLYLLWGLFFLILIFKDSLLSKNAFLFLDKIKIKYIIILSIGIRLIWVIGWPVEQVSDFKGFSDTALDIMKLKYFINPVRPTGPSFFIALHYLIFGPNSLIPTISLSLISAVQIWMVHNLIINETQDKRTALVAAILLAFWPKHIIFNNLLGSDVLFTFLILASIWLISKGRTQKSTKISVLFMMFSGIIAGLSHWMRATTPLFCASVFLFLFFDTNQVKKKVIYLASFVLGFMFLLIPMVICNKKELGKASITPSQQSGWSMLVGTNVSTHGRWNKQDEELVLREMSSKQPLPGENSWIYRNRIARDLAIKRLNKNLKQFVKMVFGYKFAALWGKSGELYWSIPVNSNSYIAITYMDRFYHMVIIILSCVAIFKRSHILIKLWNVTIIYTGFALFSTFAHVFLETKPRYNHMFLPFLVMCAASLIANPRHKITEVK
jgi:hypothetical protein